MSKRELVEKLDHLPKPKSERPALDCVETVSMYFNPTSEQWEWIYTVERFVQNPKPSIQTDDRGRKIEVYGGTWQFVDRRLGSVDLQNPKIQPQHLRRALMRDQWLGAFIPELNEWYHPLEGNEASGYEFKQKQSLARAESIHQKAMAWRESQPREES